VAGNRSHVDVCTDPDIGMKTMTERDRIDRSPYLTMEGKPIP
jgi:hypothetical protein